MDEEAFLKTLGVIKDLNIENIDDHLFCTSSERCKQVLDCFQILGYDGEDAAPLKGMFKNKVDQQLGNCTECVVSYHRLRQGWIQKLHEAYDEEEVGGFVGILNDNDNERIINGLKSASKILQGLPDEKKRIAAIQTSHQLAIFEALTCENFLIQDVLLKDYFIEVFKLVQTHKPLLVKYYLPALTQFLFSDNGSLVNWATNNWTRPDGTRKDKGSRIGEMSIEDFEFAVRRPLTRTIERLSDQLSNNWSDVTSPKKLERFWRGVNLIINRVDGGIITHGVRAMEASLYRFLIDWLHSVDRDGLLSLLSATQGLLIKGPQEFWAAQGPYSSKRMIEDIFSSPQFLPVLKGVQEVEGDRSLDLLFGWIEPFMSSLQVSQKAEACGTFVQYLMSNVQTLEYSNQVRAECYRIGLKILAMALWECCEPSFRLSEAGKIVANNILRSTAQHFDDIVSPLSVQIISATGPTEIVLLCQEVLRFALELEANTLHRERHEIHNANEFPKTFKLTKLLIWPAVCSVFSIDKTILAPICLEAITHFVGLETFESKLSNKLTIEQRMFRQEFNTGMEIACGYINDILLTLTEMSRQGSLRLDKDSLLAPCLMKILFLSNDFNYENALDLVKLISNTSLRDEAIGFVVEHSFENVLQGVIWACTRIAKAVAYNSTTRMLKIMKNVLSRLCDDQTGILKSRALSTQSATVLASFWTTQWEIVRNTYKSTAGWAAHHKVNVMQDFCRDLMDYSDMLFDQFASMESAIQFRRDQQGSGKTSNHSLDSLAEYSALNAPSIALEAMAGFLKLQDEYLLEKCVKLIWTLMTELTKRSVELSNGASTYLQKLLQPKTGLRSNLVPHQKAEIRRLLEENLGHPLEGLAGEPVTTEEVSDNKAKQNVTKQSVIDIASWSHTTNDHVRVEKKTSAQELHRKPPSKVQAPNVPIRPAKTGFDRSRAISQTQQAEFLKKREASRLEKKQRDAEAAAKAKRRHPDTLAGLTAGEGSALGNLGNLSREHLKEATDIMVDSASDEDSAEDQWTAELFNLKGQSAAVDTYRESKRAQAQRPVKPVKKIKQIRTKKDLRARVAPDLSPIHGTILSWNFFHDSDLPPGSARNDYSLVSSTFRTAHDYRKTFEPLLLLEAWQTFRQAREEITEKVFALKIVNRMNQDNLIVVSATLELTSRSDKPPFEGDILLLSKADTPSKAPLEPSCMARVFKTTQKPNTVDITIRVARGNPLLDHLVPNASLNSEKVNSIIPLEREYGALLGLEYYDLCDEIVRAYPSPLIEYNDNIVDKVMANYNLNKAQARAVKSSIDNDGFTLIQGPPGSGKTKTIVALVGALLSDVLMDNKAVPINAPRPIGTNAGLQQVVPKKLLVCAPSNAAVDELVMRFMRGIKTNSGGFHRPSVVRLGKSDSINAKVMEVTLDELVKQKLEISAPAEDSKSHSETHQTMMEHKKASDEVNAIYVTMQELKKNNQSVSAELLHNLDILQRRKQQLGNRIDQLKDAGNTSARNAEITKNKLRQEIVDGAHILCATLSGSGHDMFRNLALDFDTVIIDEAAQSIELSALIPLKYGCSKCIMVGDPKQLPPTVLSREASRFQYEQSLFVRMQGNSKNDVHLLDTQYRMHPEISVFPSQAFYDGKLLDGPNMAKITAKPWHIDPILQPYQFFDVKGMHQSGPVGHSLINRAEIEIAVKLFQRLKACARGYDFDGNVGIITPYKSQLRELRNAFQGHFGEDIIKTIDFNTTDAFQGRESEVIIFSCVRASGKGIGFLSDIRRMNVGITRAKSSLWVLGNSESLAQGEYWRKIVEDAKARKRFMVNTEIAITQPIIRAELDVAAGGSKPRPPSKTNNEVSKDTEMPDALPVSNAAPLAASKSTIAEMTRPNGMKMNGNGKRPPTSPIEATASSKPFKKQQTNPQSSTPKTKVDADSFRPQLVGNGTLEPKPIVPGSGVPRPPSLSAQGPSAVNRPPPARPPQRKKSAAETAFIMKKRPRPQR